MLISWVVYNAKLMVSGCCRRGNVGTERIVVQFRCTISLNKQDLAPSFNTPDGISLSRPQIHVPEIVQCSFEVLLEKASLAQATTSSPSRATMALPRTLRDRQVGRPANLTIILRAWSLTCIQHRWKGYSTSIIPKERMKNCTMIRLLKMDSYQNRLLY